MANKENTFYVSSSLLGGKWLRKQLPPIRSLDCTFPLKAKSNWCPVDSIGRLLVFPSHFLQAIFQIYMGNKSDSFCLSEGPTQFVESLRLRWLIVNTLVHDQTPPPSPRVGGSSSPLLPNRGFANTSLVGFPLLHPGGSLEGTQCDCGHKGSGHGAPLGL